MRLLLEQILTKYQSSVFKAAFYICGNSEDVEDIVQETFLAYHRNNREFESEEHIRAWLLRVAVNKAKNMRKSFWYRKRIYLPDFTEWMEEQTKDYDEIFDHESEEILQAVFSLPEKCRIIIHLFYYEEYSVKEIANILDIKANTVKSQLYRRRTLLRDMLKEKWENE